MEENLCTFLTSAMNREELSFSRSGQFISGVKAMTAIT
jgi:hypothetical protein